MARWMQADAMVEPGLGGRFRLGLDRGRVAMEGTITAWAPPNLLEYSWTESEANGDSRVRFELLDALDRALEGETVEIDRPRLEALRRIYAATL